MPAARRITPRPAAGAAPPTAGLVRLTAGLLGSLSGVIGRVPILNVQPAPDGGKWPAKAVVGESFEISATVFGEGHDLLGAAVVLEHPDGSRPAPVPMRELAPGTDRLGAEVTVTAEGLWHFQVAAWRDPIGQWQHDAGIKIPMGQDVELMLAEGAQLFDRAARAVRSPGWGEAVPPRQPGQSAVAARAARAALAALAGRLTDPAIEPWDRLAATEDPEILRILAAYPLRERRSRSGRFEIIVHRQRALFGAWYEFFPRSEGVQADPLGRREPVSGTLRTAARRLPAIADMGFDVVYLPPIHPIGFTNRKGRNNTLHAGPSDPGSPWAIGSPAGGHDAVHPDLGTIDDFDEFVARAGQLGLEVALDFALQCSPDHPWVSKHPEWFTTRADGSVAYAENPPKKYQDIYPVNFDIDPAGLAAEAQRIVRYWMDHGVRIFRVDNPHTKSLPFWEKLLADVYRTDPDVIFLAEAFTRPAMMHALAMIGFHQSYTYFTWRNTGPELAGYLRELAGPDAAYMRPNFFANTPDILHEYLQHGGPPAFKIRAVLAAMLSPRPGVSTPGTSCARTFRSGRAARSTWTRRSTSTGRGTGPPRTGAGRHRAVHHPGQQHQEDPPGAALAAQPALPPRGPAGAALLLQTGRDGHRPGRGEPGSAPAARGHDLAGHRRPGRGAGQRFLRDGRADRRFLPVGPGQLRPARPGLVARTHLRGYPGYTLTATARSRTRES